MRTYFKSKESQAKSKIKAKSKRQALVIAERKRIRKLMKPQVKELMLKDALAKQAVFKVEVDRLFSQVSTEEIIKFVISDSTERV